MSSAAYLAPRGAEDLFDRTAVEAWRRLTSNEPLGRVRATVRAGRDEMRATLLSWLPEDLKGARVLDAGCGAGALSVELAKRGAKVVAVDLSPTLVGLAKERARDVGVDWRVGDFSDRALGRFDVVVAMDSFIHYDGRDIARTLAGFAPRASRVLFTVAPRTPALTLMHAVGRLFPRGDRAPAIAPISGAALVKNLREQAPEWRLARAHRVARGFYISEAREAVK